jgi:hypothetical protein
LIFSLRKRKACQQTPPSTSSRRQQRQNNSMLSCGVAAYLARLILSMCHSTAVLNPTP